MAIVQGSRVTLRQTAGFRVLPFPPQFGRVSNVAGPIVIYETSFQVTNPSPGQLDEINGIVSAATFAFIGRWVRPLPSVLPNSGQKLEGVVVDAYRRGDPTRIPPEDVEWLLVRTDNGYYEILPANVQVVEGK